MMQSKGEKLQPNNELWYTSTDGLIVDTDRIQGKVSNTYVGGKGVISYNHDVTSIPYDAFINRKTLLTMSLPLSCTSIVIDSFRLCDALEEVVMPGIKSLERSFYQSGVIRVDLPPSIESIGNGAYVDCSRLRTVTIRATTPPTIGNDVFTRAPITHFFVPAESVDIYKATDGWSTYADRIFAIP